MRAKDFRPPILSLRFVHVWQRNFRVWRKLAVPSLLCGVFFPTDQLPAAMQALSAVLPLTHAVRIARPLVAGVAPVDVLTHVLVLLAYLIAGFYAALVLTRRRLLS